METPVKQGVKAYTLFESGSTTDAMSPEFAKVAKMPLYTLERPMTLKLGCVGSKSKINFGTVLDTSFDLCLDSTPFF